MSFMPERCNWESSLLVAQYEKLIGLLEELERLGSGRHLDLQAQIASLDTIFQDCVSRNSCAEIGAAVQAYRCALVGIQEFVRKTASSSQAETETEGYVGQREEELMRWKQRLLECQNILLLTLNINHDKDGVPNVNLIQALKEGLDGISREVFVVSNEIFLSDLGDLNEGTFNVEEIELMVSNGRKPKSSAFYPDCPAASFGQGVYWNPKTGYLKLACCCENVEMSHQKQLQFKVFDKTLLVAEVIPNQGKAWQMMLLKPSTKALVLAADVHRVQELAATLALRYTKNAMGSNEDNVLSESLKCRISAKSVSVQTMRCREAFMDNKLPHEIRIETKEKTIQLKWKPEYIQILHYSMAPRKMLEEREFLPNFLPEPHLELVISQQPQSCVINPSKDSVYTILIFPNSEVTIDLQKPLVLSISEVQSRLNGNSFPCIEVELFFSCLLDLENFQTYLDLIRRRLVENLAQGPSCDEKITYIQYSEAISKEFVQLHRIKVSVVISTLKSGEKQEGRMIVTREGSAGCANLSFTHHLLEVARKWKQKSPYISNVTVYGSDGVFMKNWPQSRWDMLLRQAKTEHPPSRRQGVGLGGTQLLKDLQYTSDAWLNKTDTLRAAMKAPSEAKDKYVRVKVCVIDTGFHKSDPQHKSVAGFKDFVDKNNTELRDDTWHGTLTATIILSIYPDCVLYVARVFKNNNTDEKTEPALMVEAIDWAMEKERDVDIISISAGFEKHSPPLQDAVQRAAAANKLVFAAAANYGNLRPPAFPARHELFTMCIFATNTRDQGSSFNPEWRAAAHNFALLGEGFQDRKNWKETQSGTSMATAAAAGLASLIIDFSRHPDNITIPRVQDVAKMLGMIAIFKSISKRTGNLDCVDPEKLYIGAEKGKSREWVRWNVSKAMLNAN